MNEYESKYGELTEDNFKNVLVGISDSNQVSIIPMEDISGYIFEISGRVWDKYYMSVYGWTDIQIRRTNNSRLIIQSFFQL